MVDMTSPFETLLSPERAAWQASTLQAIVDWGQSIAFQTIEGLFTDVWAKTTGPRYQGLAGFLRMLAEDNPGITNDPVHMRRAILDWTVVNVPQAMVWLEDKLSEQLLRTAVRSGEMFAERAITSLGGKFAPLEVRTTLRYNAVNPEAVAWAQERSARLITNIDKQARAVVQLLVVKSAQGELTPKQLASQVYQFIPLLPEHAVALMNSRAKMLAEGMDPKQVERNIAAHAKRLRRYRANNIARTETITANNWGVDSYFTQKHEAGLLPPSAVRVWIATRDDLTCPRCRPMHGKTSSVEGVWVAPGTRPGMVVNIPRPPLHPSCRCAIAMVTKSLLTDREVEDAFAPV